MGRVGIVESRTGSLDFRARRTPFYLSDASDSVAKGRHFHGRQYLLWGSYEALQFDDRTSMRFGAEDWDVGYYKASCHIGAYSMTGIS